MRYDARIKKLLENIDEVVRSRGIPMVTVLSSEPMVDCALLVVISIYD